jgi:hypothetical protein
MVTTYFSRRTEYFKLDREEKMDWNISIQAGCVINSLRNIMFFDG